MKLSTNSVEVIIDSFARDGHEVPDYLVPYLSEEFNIEDFNEVFFNEVKSIVEDINDEGLIGLGLCTMLFQMVTTPSKAKTANPLAPVGEVCESVVKVLEEQSKSVPERYVQISNAYYGLVFGSIHSKADVYEVSTFVNKGLEHSIELRDSALKQIRGYRDEGYLDHPFDLIKNTDKEERARINKTVAESVLIKTIIGLLGAQLGDYLFKDMK